LAGIRLGLVGRQLAFHCSHRAGKLAHYFPRKIAGSRRVHLLLKIEGSVVAAWARRYAGIGAWWENQAALDRAAKEVALISHWENQAALDHAANLVALILHGEPHIEEPLAIAWNRALGHLGLSHTPHAQLRYRLRAVVAALPGDTEIAKIAGVLDSAPSWLLDFCMASLDCFVLGIELPKSQEAAPEYGRDGLRDSINSWPDLPSGTVGAGRPIPKPNPMRALSPDEAIDLIGLFASYRRKLVTEEIRRRLEFGAR